MCCTVPNSNIGYFTTQQAEEICESLSDTTFAADVRKATADTADQSSGTIISQCPLTTERQHRGTRVEKVKKLKRMASGNEGTHPQSKTQSVAQFRRDKQQNARHFLCDTI